MPNGSQLAGDVFDEPLGAAEEAWRLRTIASFTALPAGGEIAPERLLRPRPRGDEAVRAIEETSLKDVALYECEEAAHRAAKRPPRAPRSRRTFADSSA